VPIEEEEEEDVYRPPIRYRQPSALNFTSRKLQK
jgi:hypothetical protein